MSAVTEAQLALAVAPPIVEFDGEYRWLSNFAESPLDLPLLGAHGVVPTVEHAYQAAKTLDVADRRWVLEAESPGQAKRRGSRRGVGGRAIELRADWEDVKVLVMLRLLRVKFAPGSELAAKLLATAPRVLIEGNTWGDQEWGVCDGKGKNLLGRCLMLVRQELSVAVAAGIDVERVRGS